MWQPDRGVNMYNVDLEHMTDKVQDLMRVLMLKGEGRKDKGVEYQLPMQFFYDGHGTGRAADKTRKIVRLIPKGKAITSVILAELAGIETTTANGAFRVAEKRGGSIRAGMTISNGRQAMHLWARGPNWEQFVNAAND